MISCVCPLLQPFTLRQASFIDNYYRRLLLTQCQTLLGIIKTPTAISTNLTQLKLGVKQNDLTHHPPPTTTINTKLKSHFLESDQKQHQHNNNNQQSQKTKFNNNNEGKTTKQHQNSCDLAIINVVFKYYVRGFAAGVGVLSQNADTTDPL